MVGLFLIAALSACGFTKEDRYAAYQNDAGVKIDIPIGVSFPGTGSLEDMEASASILKDVNISLIKLELDWSIREPEPGVYHWAPMDQRIDYYADRGFSVFLMISTDLPECYRVAEGQEMGREDLPAFQNFVQEVLMRYAQKIDKIQVGNEWDVAFGGTADLMVEINNIVYEQAKSINPDIQVVLGAVTTSYMIYEVVAVEGKEVAQANRQLLRYEHHLERFLETYSDRLEDGAEAYMRYVFDHAKYDIADIHLYDEAELFPDYIRILKGMTNKPILVSEYGAPNPDYEIYDEAYQYRRMKILLQTIASLDIVEAYHFSLADHPAYHGRNGLVDQYGNIKPIYYLYKNRIPDLLTKSLA